MKIKKYYEANNADLDQKLFFSLHICEYAICGLGPWSRFAICDFRINHYNLRICVLHTGTPHKFAIMQIRTNKKSGFLTPLVKRLAKSEDAKLGEYKVIECY
jgi:hypothetical protein